MKGNVLKNRTVQGFKCLSCFSTIYVDHFYPWQQQGDIPSPDSGERKSTDKCTCGATALILDCDGIIHLYTDDIKRVLLVDIILQDSKIRTNIVKATSNDFMFQDIQPILSTPWFFKPKVTKPKGHWKNKIHKAFERRNLESSN